MSEPMTPDSSPAPAERSYPITPRPEDDARFTAGLALDVADVLTRHGYPRPASGPDWVELKLALFRFLYGNGDAA
ncbi:hypothetical protein [Streptomyces cyaneofuscatus]|uniref:hypothetical protein n=1 Tax=Streptomyces cyaneofuscatus TaxID=66883 RepID=UPI0036DAC632